MSTNQQWDSLDVGSLDFPYNRLERELSDLPRLVNGSNTLVTTGGKLRRRYGTIAPFGNSLISGMRVDHCIVYETMELSASEVSQNPPHVYLVMSALNIATGLWEVWYQELKNSNVTAAAKLGTLRGLDKSQSPHEMIVARGRCYIKGTPSVANDSSVLGSVVFDGTGGVISVLPWGVPPLTFTNPAVQIIAAQGLLTGAITSTSTSFSVNTQQTVVTLPGSFVLNIGLEQINVTAYTVTGAGNKTINVTACTRGFNSTTASAASFGTLATWLGNPSTGSSWTTSAEAITVNAFWKYAVAFKEVSGNYSNRSYDVFSFFNPENTFSSTGPFSNLIPQISIDARLWNTTDYPVIAVFRTADGGGTFYQIDEITNTGNIITYSDNGGSLITNAPANTPIPDFFLTGFAPTLTSNSPPPSVIAPSIVGSNPPVTCTPPAYFQGRIWYGIGNILFFSSQEETILGVPEECFPSGVNGNFWRLQHPIVSLLATSKALYVWTYQQVYVFTGSSLDTFSYQPLFEGFGMNPLNHHARTKFGEAVVFMSQDYRVCLIQNGYLTIISDPLSTDLIDFATDGGINAQFQLEYFSDLDKEWILVCGNNQSDPTKSRQWVYDLKKARGATSEKEQPFGGIYTPTTNFWFTPWTIQSTFCVVSRQSEINTRNGLYFFTYDANTTNTRLVIQSTSATTDLTPTGLQTYDIDMKFNMNRVIPGYHINERRMPALTPPVYKLTIDRTIYPGDTDPDVYYYKDDTWNNALAINSAENPARREISIGYKTLEYPIQEVAQRVAFEIKKVGSADDFELQNMQITWEPDSGS